MSIVTIGIDLAKNVFAVHGVDDNGTSLGRGGGLLQRGRKSGL